MACLTYLAKALWFLGYADQAQQRMQEALHVAREFTHPYTLVWTLYHAAELYHFLRQPAGTQAYAESAITLCTEQGFPMFGAMVTLHRGWAIAQQTAEGLQQIRQGLRDYQKTGAEAGLPYHQSLLAEVYGQSGHAAEGLHVIETSLRLIEKTGESFYTAELHRLKGALLLQQSPDNHTEAAACFQQAITIARHQQAKSLELRAATSLTRLWQAQDKRQEAVGVLAPVYSWFAEGFDTLDVQEAKALLQTLQGGAA